MFLWVSRLARGGLWGILQPEAASAPPAPVRPVLEPPEGRVRGRGTGSLGLLWEPTLRGAVPHFLEAGGIPADVSELRSRGPTP